VFWLPTPAGENLDEPTPRSTSRAPSTLAPERLVTFSSSP